MIFKPHTLYILTVSCKAKWTDPMDINRLILTTLLALGAFCLQGQNNNCECCSYSSLQYRKNYEDILSPSLIKSKEINEVVVFTHADSTYREMKFKFDQKGQVISRTWYNRKGKPHSIYEYERDGIGKIIRQTFTYLDSLERKSVDFLSPEIIDFTYDQKSRLLKSKERDEKGNKVDDAKANFTSYDYDNKGKIVKETRQYFYYLNEPETSKYVTHFTYNDNDLKGETKTYENDRLFITSKIVYNKNWKPLREDDYNNLLNEVASMTTYKYDALNRLVACDTKAGNGSGSECPDAGTYSEKYFYNTDGLLGEIIHTYGIVKCTMTFEYR
jgi:hypothetical protein